MLFFFLGHYLSAQQLVVNWMHFRFFFFFGPLSISRGRILAMNIEVSWVVGGVKVFFSVFVPAYF